MMGSQEAIVYPEYQASFAEVTMPSNDISGGGLLFYATHREEDQVYYKWLSTTGSSINIAANAWTGLDNILAVDDEHSGATFF